MEYKEFSFEGVEVYKASRLLVRDVYRLQQTFPKHEVYALGDQIRRSLSSMTSIISEGSGRNSFKEKSHFIETEKDIDEIRPSFINVAKMLSGLKKNFENKG